MFKRLIISIDLSPASHAVVSCASNFKSLGVEEIILFHAWGKVNDDHHRTYHELEPKIRAFQKTLQEQGFNSIYELVQGIPSEELKRVAEKKNASLIIIGSHGASGSDHPLFGYGSVTSEILHSHEKPLLIVRLTVGDNDRSHFKCTCDDITKKILFATDFSEISLNALDYLASFIAFGSKEITIVHVQPLDKGSKGDMNKHEIQRLENIKLLLTSKGNCHVNYKILHGNPSEQIIAEAEDDYSLVIMGSQGKGFFDKIFLGSVSQNVARYANTSLLLIPSKSRNQE